MHGRTRVEDRLPGATLSELPCRLCADKLDCAPVVDATVYPLDPAVRLRTGLQLISGSHGLEQVSWSAKANGNRE